MYLPAGTWLDFFTGHRIAGGRTITRSSTPLDFPLYVRAGSALAANLRSPAVWADPWRVNDLIRPGRQGWLVAPAAGTIATARSQGTTLSAAEPIAGEVAITLKRAAREQQLLVLTSSHVCRVLVDGAAVPIAASAATLRTQSAGWLVETAPRRGVVVKAQTPRNAVIDLQPC